MLISRFTSHHSTSPIEGDITWERLVERLSKPTDSPCTVATCRVKDCEHKNGYCWSPVKYKPHTGRAKRNVQEVYALVIDIDQISPKEMRRVDRQLKGYKRFYHSTHSHREDSICMRVVIPLSEPVPGPVWTDFFHAALQKFDIPYDIKAQDPSRLYYEPNKPSDSPFWAWESEGRPLTPSEISIPERASERVSEPVGEGAISEYRNSTLMSIAGKLRHMGLTPSEIAKTIHTVNEERCDPPLDREEIDRTILRSIENYQPSSDIVEDVKFSEAVDDMLSRPPGETEEFFSYELTHPDVLNPEPLITIPSGFREIDENLGGGLQCSRVHTIAGASGTGKTSFVLSLAKEIEKTRPVLYYSTELGLREVSSRIAGNTLRLSWQAIEQGKIDRAKVNKAFDNRNMRVIPYNGLPRDTHKLARLKLEVDRMEAKHGVAPVLIVDYVQMLVNDKTKEIEELDYIYSFLHDLAEAKKIPVIAVSSVSRAYTGINKNKNVNLDDPESYASAAKGSGAIEYFSGAVFYLETDYESFFEVPPPTEDNPHPQGHYFKMGRVVMAKVRSGRAGFVGARYYGASGEWVSDEKALEAMSPDARKERLEKAKGETLDEQIKAQLKDGPKSSTEIKDAIGGKPHPISKRFPVLVASGQIYDKKGPGQLVRYSLKPFEEFDESVTTEERMGMVVEVINGASLEDVEGFEL